MNIFNLFCFSLTKKRARTDPKNRLRLQLKNLGSDRLRLRNTVLKYGSVIQIFGWIRIQRRTVRIRNTPTPTVDPRVNLCARYIYYSKKNKLFGLSTPILWPFF